MAAANPPPPPRNNRRVQSALSGLRARHSTIVAADSEDLTFRPSGVHDTVELWISNNGVTCAQITNTCSMLLNSPSLSDVERCVYWFNAMIAITPGLRTVAESYFKECGYGVTVLNDAGIRESGIRLQGWIEVPKVAVLYGQLALLLFKNITDVSYNVFFGNRTRGLQSAAGLATAESQVAIPATIEAAKIIRTRLGSFVPLKQHIVRTVINNESKVGPFGNTCRYLAKILSYNEMGAIEFITKALLDTRSPVLFDPRVSTEVNNLAEATMAIGSADFPQYFRILYPVEAERVLERAKFPTLLAVAQACYSKMYPTARNFVSTRGDNAAPIQDLVTLHENYMNGPERRGASQAVIDFLTNNDHILDDLYG